MPIVAEVTALIKTPDGWLLNDQRIPTAMTDTLRQSWVLVEFGTTVILTVVGVPF